MTVSVILCRPQLAVNVGACARVMSNMDFHDLRIVHPRDADIVEQARENATHAGHILDRARLFETLEDAIADLSFVAMTSARNRDIEKKNRSLSDFVDIFKMTSGKSGVVFGPERTGLTNQELVLADVVIQIKTGAANKSYNLSHAVAIVLYSIFADMPDNQKNEDVPDLASKKEISLFLSRLEKVLEETGYFKEENKKEGQSLNIKNMFTRDYITRQDIKTLHGMINHLKKQ